MVTWPCRSYYNSGNRNICTTFQSNLSNSSQIIFIQYHKCQPHVSARWKIHLIFVDMVQFGPKWWTNQLTNKHGHTLYFLNIIKFIIISDGAATLKAYLYKLPITLHWQKLNYSKAILGRNLVWLTKASFLKKNYFSKRSL